VTRRALAPVVCLVALCACNPQAPKTAASPSSAPSSSSSENPSLHITGQGTASQPVRFLDQRGNHVDDEILADSYESKGPQGKAHVVFRAARITFHGANGTTLTATAPQAILDQTANTVTLLGGVKSHSATGMSMTCSQLLYDRVSQTFHGSGNVVIIDPKGFKATGSSFDSDVSLTHVRMK
jgi:Lipopolysaccharide-assembly, LptC-related